jgi:hypothetical protein
MLTWRGLWPSARAHVSQRAQSAEQGLDAFVGESQAGDAGSGRGDDRVIGCQPRSPDGSVREGWLSSTDHKVIRYLYLSTAFGFFLIGVTALLLRI